MTHSLIDTIYMLLMPKSPDECINFIFYQEFMKQQIKDSQVKGWYWVYSVLGSSINMVHLIKLLGAVNKTLNAT